LDFALGYADSQEVLNFNSGTALWSGQVIYEHDPQNEPPFRSVLIKFTYYGDTNVDGKVNIADFARWADNFNSNPSRWDRGDLNYDGTTNIRDFSLLANHFNWGNSGDTHPQLRPLSGSLPPISELFIAMLDRPAIYWESWLDPDLRNLFEPYWSLNLGPAPAIPAYLQSQVQARGVPEPAAALMTPLLCASTLKRRRR